MRHFLFTCLLALAACGTDSPPPAAVDLPIASGLKFADQDPHAWDGRSPDRYAIHGIDVARFQSDIDWRSAKAAGVSFAFIKATEGGDLADPMFENHRKGARKAGVPWAAYHFYYFCRPAADQAKWFIENVPRSGNKLPHVLDMEWNPFSPTCTLRPDGAIVRREAKIFLDMLEDHYGRRPIIYTTPDFYKQTGIGKLRGTEFWLRSVANTPEKVYPGQRWSFWQYTSTGLIPGIEGGVDINVFRGSAEDWARYLK